MNDKQIMTGGPKVSEEQVQERAGLVLTSTLKTRLEQARNYRAPVERRWLSDLRQYHGVYEADVEGSLNGTERSKLFINMTRPKTNGWSARLTDLLFPADDKNWGIEPTPVPELSDHAKETARLIEKKQLEARQAAEENNQLVEAGAPMEQVAPVQQKAYEAKDIVERAKELQLRVQTELEQAKQCSFLMEREINDQFVESRYAAICRDIIDDACKLGIGILKGPVLGVNQAARGRWGQSEDGTYAYGQDGDPKPKVRRVDPWHFFPDNATSIEDCEYTFERHVKNKAQFRKMAKQMGFNPKATTEILKDDPKLDIADGLKYLDELRAFTDDLGSVGSILSRYVVWEYHGPLSKNDVMDLLTAVGRTEDAAMLAEQEDYEERRVICFFCQDQILKIAEDYPMDSGESLYSVFPFERAESSILGAVGIPRMMRHEQAMLNSGVRMMVDHAAISAGPQVVVDKALIVPQDGSWELKPFKIWTTDEQSKKGNMAEPFKLHYITMNQAQLNQVIVLAQKFIDDVISLPMIAQGEQGHATPTLGGMSMLFNSANVIFRRVVKNWDDDITAPTVRRFYDWNMQFNPKDEIKGDMRCEARGTSVLLVREVQAQQLQAIAMQWSKDPVIGPAIKVYGLLRLTLQAMALNPSSVLVDEDEFEKRITQMAEAEAAAAEAAGAGEGADTIRAEAALQSAQITADARIQVATMERETKIMELMLREDMNRTQVEAMLAKTKMVNEAGERRFAAELGAETKAKREAEAMGMTIDGSGGSVNLAPQPLPVGGAGR